MGKILIKAFSVIWETNRFWLIFNVFYTIVLGVIPVFTILLSKELIDEIVILLQKQSSNPAKVFFILFLQSLLILVSSLLSMIRQYIDKKMEKKLEHKLQQIVFKKIAAVPLTYFDDSRFYDSLSRLHSPGSRFLNPITELCDFFKNCISVISVITYLLSVHWSLLFLAMVPGIPFFLAQFKFGQERYKFNYNNTPLLRDISLTSRLLQSRNGSKEIKLFCLSDHLISRWSTKYLEEAIKSLRLFKRQQYTLFGIDVFNSLIYIFTIYIIVKLIRLGGLGIGEYVAIVQSVQETQNKISQASNNIAKLYEASLYLNDYYSFMETEENTNPLKERENHFPRPLQKGIFIENITFSYLKSSKLALNDVSLSINAGEKIAIVGENGSGKSTLVKCILGLYPIQKGNIFFDDVSISNIRQEELHKNLTALFQDYVKYPYTVHENIAFGDISKIESLKSIKNVAKKTGVDDFIKTFKEGYKTYLTRELYDGEDLSGGQWQRIALTRTFLRDAQLLILDEPTASMDPKTENEVLEQFYRITNGKTAIFISHRLSTTRLADRIVVMKNGKIIEVGTYSELISNGGEFTKMYKLQAEHFQHEEIFSM